MVFTNEAIELYERASQRGWWYQLAARLRGRPARLLDLMTIAARCRISARHYLGEQTVPILQIRGSEMRRADFDDAFHPLRENMRSRWQAVAMAWLQGASLPPINLIRLGESYFVRDGHHRISVARALGQREIDAIVTVWDVAGLI